MSCFHYLIYWKPLLRDVEVLITMDLIHPHCLQLCKVFVLPGSLSTRCARTPRVELFVEGGSASSFTWGINGPWFIFLSGWCRLISSQSRASWVTVSRSDISSFCHVVYTGHVSCSSRVFWNVLLFSPASSWKVCFLNLIKRNEPISHERNFRMFQYWCKIIY